MSGIFGLLTEFKDKDKKITISGKIALAGIVLGFMLSGVITVLEVRNSNAEADKNAQEVRRLQRPLEDPMTVLFAVSIRKDSKLAEHFRPQLTQYFRGLIQHKVRPDPSLPIFTSAGTANQAVFVMEQTKLPLAFRSSQSPLAGILADSVIPSPVFTRCATATSSSVTWPRFAQMRLLRVLVLNKLETLRHDYDTLN